MSWKKWASGAVGAGVGFLVGGPAGAWLGAGIGYGARQGYEIERDIRQARRDAKKSQEEAMRDRVITTDGSNNPRQLIYGETRCGGQLLYRANGGEDDRYIYMVISFADHSCEEISKIYFDEEHAVSVNPNGTIFAAKQKYQFLVYGFVQLGNQAEPPEQVISSSTEANNFPGWTADHVAKDQTILYLRLDMNEDAFYSGVPNVSALIKGKNDIYDPRTNQTGWTDNQALCVMDYMRWDQGLGINDDRIDLDAFKSAADIADDQVADGDGGTEKRYTINGMVTLDKRPPEILQTLMDAGAMELRRGPVKFSPIAAMYSDPVTTITEDDLIGGIDYAPHPDRSSVINAVRGTFVDPNENFAVTEFVRLKVDEYIDQDKEQKTSDLSLPFTNSSTMARRLGKIELERARFGAAAEMRLKYRAFNLRAGQRIQLSLPSIGIEGKILRIKDADYDIFSGVGIRAREDSPAIYTWTEDDAKAIEPSEILHVTPTDPIPAPQQLNITERLNLPRTQNQDLVTIVLDAGLSPDDRWGAWKYSYRASGLVDWSDIEQTRGQASVVLAADGTTYTFRAQPVSINGRVYQNAATEDYTVYNRRVQGLPEPDTSIPSIHSLRLVNTTGPGVFDQFKSGNAEFEWQPRSQVESTEFGWDEIGADQGQFDPHFDHYQVTFFSADGRMLMQDKTRDPWYELTIEDNRKFGIGREFSIEVYAVGANAHQGEPERLSVINPQAEAVTDITVAYTQDDITLSYTVPDDIDFRGVRALGKLYTGNSFSIDPITSRSVQISLTSVDIFGDGLAASVTLTNPAPNAVTNVSLDMGVESATINFTPPDNDYDFRGVRTRFRELGETDWSSPLNRTSSGAPVFGLEQNTDYEFELTSFDSIGDGGQIIVNGTTRQLVAADIDGLGGWATRIDPADLEFIQDNMAEDAIPSTRIQSLVAGKIAAGAVSVQVDVGEGANSVLLDGVSGIIRSISGGATFEAYIGAHTVDGQSYIYSANDTANTVFGIRPDGSGKFGELELSSAGAIAGPGFNISEDGAVFGDPNGERLSFLNGNFALQTDDLQIVNGNATFSGTLAAASGSFEGSVTANDGVIAGLTIFPAGLRVGDDVRINSSENTQTRISVRGPVRDDSLTPAAAIEVSQGVSDSAGANAYRYGVYIGELAVVTSGEVYDPSRSWLHVNGATATPLTFMPPSSGTGDPPYTPQDPGFGLNSIGQIFWYNGSSWSRIDRQLPGNVALYYPFITSTNLNYPVGSILSVFTGSTHYIRNSPINIYLADLGGGNETGFSDNSSDGGQLQGEWRTRGYNGYSASSSSRYYLAQRID